MKYLKSYLNHISILITFILLSFLLAFFFTEYIYNNNNTYYETKLTSKIIEVEDFNADFFMNALKKVDKDGNISYSYSSVKPKEFYKNKDIKVFLNDDQIVIRIKARYFISSNGNTVSSESLERYDKVMKKVISFYDKEAKISLGEIYNHQNGYKNGIITSFLIFILFTIIFSLLYINDKIKLIENRYDNIEIFKFPFRRLYWKKALDEVLDLKIFKLCLISILFALELVCKFITIPSGFANLGIGLAYLILGLICMIYGPIWALIIGLFSDILGFILFPSGFGFYFGYTIQAMLSCLVYALLFYRAKISFTRVLIARIFVNIFVNAIFGSYLWMRVSGLTYEGAKVYFLTLSLPKNLVYLIPQTILLYLFLKASIPIYARKNIISKKMI